jgi:hypothetical protein
MGKYDSSRTRVTPVFTRLLCSDPTGKSWIPTLLGLPESGRRTPVSSPAASLDEARWWPSEKPLAPPLSLLRWLVQNVKAPKQESGWGTGETADRRKALVRQEPEVIKEALSRLSRPRDEVAEKDWAVLEGPSQPDVFLATKDTVIVIEGKRTESGPTIGTTWFPERHQMLRHLDAAWEIRNGRRLYGFFIVETAPDTVKVPQDWIRFAAETNSTAALAASLPHRNAEERQRIGESFLGVTTWQAVCSAFQIPEEVLIHKVLHASPTSRISFPFPPT